VKARTGTSQRRQTYLSHPLPISMVTIFLVHARRYFDYPSRLKSITQQLISAASVKKNITDQRNLEPPCVESKRRKKSQSSDFCSSRILCTLQLLVCGRVLHPRLHGQVLGPIKNGLAFCYWADGFNCSRVSDWSWNCECEMLASRYTTCCTRLAGRLAKWEEERPRKILGCRC